VESVRKVCLKKAVMIKRTAARNLREGLVTRTHEWGQEGSDEKKRTRKKEEDPSQDIVGLHRGKKKAGAFPD